MRVRFVKMDEFKFLTCLKNQAWGSKTACFMDWREGDFLVFIVDKTVAGVAEVSGEPYVSRNPIWDNGLFPHRIPLKFTHAFQKGNRLPILGEMRNALTSAWGPKYRWRIRDQQIIQEDSAKTIIKAIGSRQNDLSEFQTHIKQYLDQNKKDRDLLQIAIQNI